MKKTLIKFMFHFLHVAAIIATVFMNYDWAINIVKLNVLCVLLMLVIVILFSKAYIIFESNGFIAKTYTFAIHVGTIVMFLYKDNLLFAFLTVMITALVSFNNVLHKKRHESGGCVG